MEGSNSSDDEWDNSDDDWELLQTGRSPTELVVSPRDSISTKLLVVGLVSSLYGIGLVVFPLPGLPSLGAKALILLGAFFCLLKVLLSDAVLWDLRNKKAHRVVNFAGSKWVRQTFEGDEVFIVVVEAVDGGRYGLSLLTRFGHRYQVLPPAFERRQVKEDAERLARYFRVPVKEGTPGVIPSARASKSPILKWQKRPKSTVRMTLLVTALLIPLFTHVAGPILGRL